MAKQTFTTGNVLTALQMNNLQANDWNWELNGQTASYVLVAADAGKRVQMNAAGSTTITVNTGLFTAGDTVLIQNIGAGTCTITAGTATVNKATNASLALAQYQGGTLYFVSASSSIFFPFDIGAGGGQLQEQSWTSSTTWTVPTGVTRVLALVQAGGGGGGGSGGGYAGGGGGGGGQIYDFLSVTPGASVTVTVGGGGAGGANSDTMGSNGSNSVFSSLTATGGGGGGRTGSGGSGGNTGGCGGGAGNSSNSSVTDGGKGSQGGNGGYCFTGTSPTGIGNGGIGRFGYGGGGSAGSNQGGAGGGGAGGNGDGKTQGQAQQFTPTGGNGGGANPGNAAAANTGGGGAGASTGAGFAGGSGIVKVWYIG